MAPRTAFSESDLNRARREVRDLEDRHASEREAADTLVADMRESGTDPLADGDAFTRVDEAYRVADETAEELTKARSRRDRIAELVGHPVGGDSNGRGGGSNGHRAAEDVRRGVGTWGQAILGSDQYAQLRDSGVLRSQQAAINLPPVAVASRDELQATLFRAQVIGDHGPLVPSDRSLVPPLLEPQREIMVIDLLTIGQTDSDTVEYAQETTRTSGAGGRAFGAALGEFNVTWEPVTVSVRRRGAMHTATRGNLADQGQLRTILDSLLEEDVRQEAEDQVVAGDGLGENFTGIYNTAGVGSVQRAAGESFWDVAHRGLTVVRLARRRDPNAFLIHPNNHEEMILEKDGGGSYRVGSATESDRRTVWGLAAVPSEAATQDLPVWGRWTDATLWLREGLSVSAFNQHADYASRGLVLITAEHRAAFRATRPTGFCTVNLIPPV